MGNPISVFDVVFDVVDDVDVVKGIQIEIVI